MAGRVPAIYIATVGVDGRDTPGHDGGATDMTSKSCFVRRLILTTMGTRPARNNITRGRRLSGYGFPAAA